MVRTMDTRTPNSPKMRMISQRTLNRGGDKYYFLKTPNKEATVKMFMWFYNLVRQMFQCIVIYFGGSSPWKLANFQHKY